MSIKVNKVISEYKDSRGSIFRIIDEDKLNIKSILYIKSKAGSIRGNHYHKNDYHYVYCIKGKFKYYEKSVGTPKSPVQFAVIKSGDLVLTKPGVIHAMEFMEDSVFMAFATENRTQAKYENDTQRVKLIGK